MRFAPPSGGLGELLSSQHLLAEWLADGRFTLIADLLPDALLIVDGRGILRFMNSAAEALHEVHRRAHAGRPFAELVKESPLLGEAALEALGRGRRLQRVDRTVDGREVLTVTRPVRDADGDLALFVLVQRDLEAIRRAAASAPSLDQADGGGGEYLRRMVAGAHNRRILEKGLRALRLGSRVLLTGESGVDKTLIARCLHEQSAGRQAPFIHVNCASIPESLFESEMFGYERGAFTGALQRGKRGLIEAADGGTLFLDEVGEIPLACQAKLLRFLEDQTVTRLGATGMRRVRVQIVAATNRDLRSMVESGRFRRDLFYRLSTISLRIPPLRACPEMIPDLVELFVREASARRGEPFRLSEACLRQLRGYHFPGNIRELQNIVDHLAVMCDGVAEPRHLPEALLEDADRGERELAAVGIPVPDGEMPSAEGESLGLRERVRRFESAVIAEAIRRCGSKRKAAAMLGVDIATIVRKSRD